MQRVTALTLLRYKHWMDAGMLSAIAETDARRFRAEHREMVRLMYHMHATDMLIRANLKGEALSRPNIRPRRPPEQAVLVPCMLACSGWFIEYAAGMTAEAWDRPIIYQRRDEKMAQTSPQPYRAGDTAWYATPRRGELAYQSVWHSAPSGRGVTFPA